jgi:phosphate:Na+ symporter
MLNEFEFWKFLAGLGIFLFGMFLLEESIRLLSGRAFKRLIKKATTGRIRAILLGAFSTAVLQSSSAVSLMTLAFAGAGILSMQNAVGVIFGTNIGTTATGWIIATIGFKIDIEGIALPLIGIGGLGLIFLSKSARFSGLSKLFVGFGFLFMGLDYMKLSVEQFTAAIDLATIPHYGLWFYVLLGILLTALMQSSSATIAIILTALNAGIISFSDGAAMVIGANIGTTVTILLGSIGAVQIKKQIAVSHLIFNFATGLVALILLPFFVRVVEWLDPGGTDSVLGIAVFHTTFNLLGVLMFLPFIGLLVRSLQKWFPGRTAPTTRYINNVSPDLPEAAVHALYLELRHLFKETLAFFAVMLNPDKRDAKLRAFAVSGSFADGLKKRTPEEQLAKTRELHNAIGIYASNIRHGELDVDEKARIHRSIHVSMLLTQVTKTLWGIKQELDDLEASSNTTARESYHIVRNSSMEYLTELLNTVNEDRPILAEIKLPETLASLEEDTGDFIATIAGRLDTSTIEEKHAASLLAVSGLLAQMGRQLFDAANVLVMLSLASEGGKRMGQEDREGVVGPR